MRLDRVDVGGGQAGAVQGLLDDPLLRGAVGGGQAVAGAVLVDGGAADQGEHRVPVAAGVRQPLQQQHADAFGPGGAVGRCRESLAAAVGRQPALAAELDERLRSRHYGDPAGQRQRALARAQGLRGQVHRDQRGGAGGVHGHRRALQAEGVRDAPRGHAAGAADAQVALELPGGLADPGAVVPVAGADEDAALTALQRQRVDPGPFERLPGDFEQQALLWVDGDRLAWGDPEEERIEVTGVVQESALAGIGPAGPPGIGVVQAVEVPSPVGGEGGDGVRTGRDQLPQLLGRVDPAREAAAHRDDRDRFARVVGHWLGHWLGRRIGEPLGRRPGSAVHRRRAEQFGKQLPGEHGGGRIVEYQGHRQPQPGGLGQLVPQLDGGQRVEADVPEHALGLDRLRIRVTKDRGDLRAYQRGHRGPPLGRAQPGQPPGERAALVPLPGRVLPGLGQVPQQRAGPRCGEGADEALPGEVADHHPGVVVVQRLPQRDQGQFRRHRGQAVADQPLAHRAAGRAVAAPQAPGNRGGGQPRGPALLRQGVQEGVGRRVAALPGAAEGARQRGEKHERRQVQIPGQDVQVQRRVHLRPQYPGRPLRGQRIDQPVVQDARRVDHGPQRVLGRDTGYQRRQRVPVRDIAGRHHGFRPEPGQLGHQLGGSRRGRAPATGQQQPPGTGPGQPAGDMGA